MKLPDRYLNLSVAGYPLNLGDLAAPESWPQADIYPPPGFIQAIPLFEIGNGDVTGFYWPIGKENDDPIFCDTYHDEWSLEPQASSLEALVKLKAVQGYCKPGDAEYQTAQELAVQLGFDLPPAAGDKEISPNLWLSLDASSPAALKSAAVQSLKVGELEMAAAYLEHALQVLPEYTEVLFMIGNLYRRQRKLPDAAQKMVEALSAPLCFSKDRKGALQAVKRLHDEDYPELQSDPLWSHRHTLTFATGVKRNDDFDIYEESVLEYLRQGRGILAVRLRVLIGELMWGETISFRDRSDYSLEKHRQLLKDNIEAAGLTARLVVLGAPHNFQDA